MSFLDFATAMFPYWLLGLYTFISVFKSKHKDLLNFNPKSFFKFLFLMTVVTVWRVLSLKIQIHNGIGLSQLQAVNSLPIGGCFFVGWEDIVHTLPLALLRRYIGTSKWTWPIHILATLMVMIAFGAGHVYQGVFAAAIISLYIPFSLNFAQKKGFGTLIAGHMLYDIATLLTVKLALG